ncbi:probable histone acetyltransferase HAC-like 1 isoform X2 [Zingiber officinale]|uniref:probable histone acetyltransferase HAC-like 1 isoform X2 n=1 Tax=Zingiber officinale TaxID=94328 RepID=UPI001C4BDF24|nr:probable histone acetyltransferase HAC-like 1 isoform X2 [Zingiber officinale]
MDPEFMQLRRQMQQKIYNILQRKNQSNDWLCKLPEIVKRLEEGVFRDTATKMKIAFSRSSEVFLTANNVHHIKLDLLLPQVLNVLPAFATNWEWSD